ncbi:MAG: hypothetical protein K9M03_02080 [Kiritimatiellales bacterium]|nr:hypothetical protein [Kiritimatiellales bacterium]
MEKTSQSPWLVVALVIVGIVIGYALVIQQGAHTTAASGGGNCPNKELCNKGEDCGCKDEQDCKKANCTGDCLKHGA